MLLRGPLVVVALAVEAELLHSIGVGCQDIGYFAASDEIALERDSQLVPWVGVDAERFTGSSWRRSKLGEYIDRVLEPRSDR